MTWTKRFENHKPLLKTIGCIAWWAFFFGAAIYLLSRFIPFYFEPTTSAIPIEHKASFPVELNAALIIGLTFILVVSAWHQLTGLNKTDRSKFLLSISERYGSEQILKAREIIHELYMESKEKNQSFQSESEHRTWMGQKIIDYSISKFDKPDEMKKYVTLLSFLDFLETIAYMANVDKWKQDDLSETLGNSLLFYYEIFRPKIYQRREKYEDNSFYMQIENLAHSLKRAQRHGLL